MARETIYENPNVALSGGEGMVTNLLLIPGETYQIMWDDVGYTSTAAEVPFDGMTVVAIGDLGLALGAPTGEYPFLIGALPDGSLGYAFTTESGVTSHSLVIYREGEDEPANDGYKTILSERSFDFSFSEESQTWGCTIVSGSLLGLKSGKAYKVIWGNKEYKTAAVTVNEANSEAAYVLVGNPALVDMGTDNDLPFAIADIPILNGCACTTKDEGDTRTIAIYETEAIVLKNRSGKNVSYAANSVRLPMSDGSTQLFVNAADVPEPVSLTVGAEDVDFTKGYMEVTPDTGKVLSKVTVEKPANLLAENIAEGIDIAGIIGTLAVGGGASIKFSNGTFTGNGGSVTVTHGLGVLPDIIFLETGTSNTMKASSTPYVYFGVGFSSDFASLYNPGGYCVFLTYEKYYSNTKTYTKNKYGPYGGINYSTSSIRDANDQTVTFGVSSYPVSANYNYRWFAIGGLT